MAPTSEPLSLKDLSKLVTQLTVALQAEDITQAETRTFLLNRAFAFSQLGLTRKALKVRKCGMSDGSRSPVQYGRTANDLKNSEGNVDSVDRMPRPRDLERRRRE